MSSGALLFIHSAVDDFGLTPVQFRVLCAIARRGKCFEQVDTLAKRIRMHKDTAWEAMRFLTEHRIVNRIKQAGSTTIFSVNENVEQWIPTGNEGATETKGRPSKSVSHRKRRGAHLAETKGRISISPEVSPCEGGRIAGAMPATSLADVVTFNTEQANGESISAYAKRIKTQNAMVQSHFKQQFKIGQRIIMPKHPTFGGDTKRFELYEQLRQQQALHWRAMARIRKNWPVTPEQRLKALLKAKARQTA
jgi:hypothetical protein